MFEREKLSLPTVAELERMHQVATESLECVRKALAQIEGELQAARLREGHSQGGQASEKSRSPS